MDGEADVVDREPGTLSAPAAVACLRRRKGPSMLRRALLRSRLAVGHYFARKSLVTVAVLPLTVPMIEARTSLVLPLIVA